MDRRGEYLEKAEALKPTLRVETARPAALPEGSLTEGDRFVLDFGNHFVGRLTLKLGYEGSHPDAPTWLKIKFCESPRELNERVEDYHGWISRGWIQEEQIHIDALPCALTLPRRYAFRYVNVEVLAVSRRFRLTVEDAQVDATTSADDRAVAPFSGTPEEAAIDRVALRTLRNCMQDFFEDGPKRDRRLWLGDLRLQALANYATYRNDDLVKSCLYLFAATAGDDGLLTACLFTEPKVEPDDNWMLDYAMLYGPTLLDYVEHTGDRETGLDLLAVAQKQIELADAAFDPDTEIVRDEKRSPFFVDWNLRLNKQAAGQAIWIYCAKAVLRLMKALDREAGSDALKEKIDRRSRAAVAHFYDAERRLFVSGEEKQVSWASQVWFALAEVLPPEEIRACLQAAENFADIAVMVTPYMMHHYVDALYRCGMPEKGRQTLLDYWGGMVRQGADTFYELYNPANPDESPYGSPIVNSYCHAWSCTPVCFLRGTR